MNEGNPETNTQEPDEYRPEIIDHNALQQIEGAEVTAQVPTTLVPDTVPVVQTQNPVVVPTVQPIATETLQKPRRGLKIALITIASLLIIAALGLAVFYFIIRTPDSKYDAAAKDLQTMKTSAEAIRNLKINGPQAADFETSPQYSTVRQNAAAYADALTKLQNGPVLKKDIQVKLAYADNKALIEPYGQSTLDMTDTLVTYQNVNTTCLQDLNKGITYQTTRRTLDSTFSNCKKLISDHPTVPMKAFNDGYYVKYVAVVKRIIDGAYAYADSLDSGIPSDELRATTELKLAISQYSVVTESAGDISITNTAQPSSKIGDVIKAVQQRKDVFFRR
ncbi:MAG: hypothetical protein ABI354_02000 [Candidatus Saccharimonadales bacterium]